MEFEMLVRLRSGGGKGHFTWQIITRTQQVIMNWKCCSLRLQTKSKTDANKCIIEEKRIENVVQAAKWGSKRPRPFLCSPLHRRIQVPPSKWWSWWLSSPSSLSPWSWWSSGVWICGQGPLTCLPKKSSLGLIDLFKASLCNASTFL